VVSDAQQRAEDRHKDDDGEQDENSLVWPAARARGVVRSKNRISKSKAPATATSIAITDWKYWTGMLTILSAADSGCVGGDVEDQRE